MVFLYTEIFAQTLHLLLPTTDREFRAYRDERHLKKISLTKFNKIVKLDLLPSLPANAIIEIKALNSSANPNIQIADWICGALSRYYNSRKDGKEFFLLLKNSIIVSDELFKDYWINKKFR